MRGRLDCHRHVGRLRPGIIQSRQRRLAETLQIGKVYQILYFSQSLFTCCRTQLAFPHSHHFPSHFSQFGLVALVTAAVTSDFILPKFHIRVREMPIDAMPVPEAPMNENHDSILALHNIGRTRQPFHIFQVTISARIKITAHYKLGLCILAPDLSHHCRPLLFIPNIHRRNLLVLLQIYIISLT